MRGYFHRHPCAAVQGWGPPITALAYRRPRMAASNEVIRRLGLGRPRPPSPNLMGRDHDRAYFCSVMTMDFTTDSRIRRRAANHSGVCCVLPQKPAATISKCVLENGVA